MVKDLCTVNMREALTASGCLSNEALLTLLWNRPINRYAVGIQGKLDLPSFDTEAFKSKHPDCTYITTSQNVSSDYGDDDNEDILEDEDGFSIINGRIMTCGTNIYFNDKIIELNTYTINTYYIGDKTEIIELIDEIVEEIGLEEEKLEERSIDLIGYADGSYFSTTEKVNTISLDIDKQYNDDFKVPYKKIVDFLDPENRQSGVVLLSGIPGSGKSSFIRFLLEAFPNKFVLITPAIAARLAEPDFISYLLAHKNSVYILEDCEQVIMSREDSSFGSAIASLLNMSDGLMSDIFNGKFICTFNTDIENVDKALLRKGRCIVNYEFKPLEAKKVKPLLKNFYGVDYDSEEPMTLADIYNYEEQDTDTHKPVKIGF